MEHGATFPIYGKINVNGPDADPLYKFLKAARPGKKGGDIQWNFAKFLVNKDGLPVYRYAPGNNTTSNWEKDVLALLGS